MVSESRLVAAGLGFGQEDHAHPETEIRMFEVFALEAHGMKSGVWRAQPPSPRMTLTGIPHPPFSAGRVHEIDGREAG